MTLALRYAVRSDVGLLREGNEDSAYAGPHLLAVADGMGGYEAGEVASAAVISTVAPLDRRPMPESELIDALAAAVTTAKQALRRIVDSDPAVGSMGTTLTAMLWAGGSAAICHIGDSRAYLVRDGDPDNVTCLVADVIDLELSDQPPTSAPVVVGAAAASGGNHDTKPFSRPMMDGTGGITTLGTVPGTAAAPSRPRDTLPGQARPQQERPATIPAGRHAVGAVADDDEDDIPATRRRRRWPVMTSILALFVLLVGGGAFFAYEYVHSQYYVGTAGGKVVIYQGLDQKLLGVSLSSVYRRTDIPAAGITSASTQAIKRAPAGSLAEATQFVANIRKGYDTCQAAYAAVRSWVAGKPKPRTIKVKVNGRLETKTVTPKYRPKPPIPADCPPMPP